MKDIDLLPVTQNSTLMIQGMFFYSQGICTDWFNKYCKNCECTLVYDGSHTSLFWDNNILLVSLLVTLYFLYITKKMFSISHRYDSYLWAMDPIVAKPTLNPGLHLGIHFLPALTWSQGIFSSSIETKRPFWIFEPEQKYSKQ